MRFGIRRSTASTTATVRTPKAKTAYAVMEIGPVRVATAAPVAAHAAVRTTTASGVRGIRTAVFNIRVAAQYTSGVTAIPAAAPAATFTQPAFLGSPCRFQPDAAAAAARSPPGKIPSTTWNDS